MDSLTLSWSQVGAILVGVAGATAWILKRVDKKFERVDKKFDRLEGKIDHLGERAGKIENRLTAIETILPYVTPSKVFHLTEDQSKEELKEN